MWFGIAFMCVGSATIGAALADKTYQLDWSWPLLACGAGTFGFGLFLVVVA